MKKLISGLLLCSITLLFSGCQKIIDHIFPHHNGGEHPATCKITSIGHNELVERFHYDPNGRLDSIVPNVDWNTNPGALVVLSYDNAGRLRSMVARQQLPFKVEAFHYYGYTGNKITTDTVTDHSTSTSRIWLCTLTYDNNDRIIHETRELLYSDNEHEQPFIDLYYDYDPDGNVQSTQLMPVKQYDDHRSLLSTDETLQFLARDYSRNNTYGGSVYNGQDLPTNFIQFYNFTYFPPEGPAQGVIPISKVTYDCE